MGPVTQRIAVSTSWPPRLVWVCVSAGAIIERQGLSRKRMLVDAFFHVNYPGEGPNQMQLRAPK
eukprot:9357449-Pyramimonas_sp.AAC.1